MSLKVHYLRLFNHIYKSKDYYMEMLFIMKKLLVTASTFPRWENDTEPRFVLDLCKAMSKNFDITVMVPSCPGAKDKEILEGVKVLRYHYFPIHRFETLCYPGAIVPRIKEKKIRALLVPFLFFGLWNALRKNLKDYDYVHAHWLIPQGIIQSLFNKPYIVTGHGGDVCSLNRGIARKLKIKCIRNAKHVTVVSDHLKSRVQCLCNSTPIDVISMGVDLNSFGDKYFVKNYFGQGEKKVILFVGRLAEIKGVSYLIQAMHYIDAMLVIVGEGPLKNELEQQAYVQSLQENPNSRYSDEINSLGGKRYGKIVFLGGRSHEELKSIYASADVFCMPSITTSKGEKEGFGLVIIEAMASGLPVVASDSGGISQIIENNKNGMLFEEKNVWQIIDLVSLILDDTSLYKKLRAGGYETAKSTSYDLIAEQYSKLMS